MSAIVTGAFLRISELVAESTNLVSVAHLRPSNSWVFSEFQSRSIVALPLVTPLGPMTSRHHWDRKGWGHVSRVIHGPLHREVAISSPLRPPAR